MNPENKIRLLHIFPDLMNLYGDYANLAVLSVRSLKWVRRLRLSRFLRARRYAFGRRLRISGRD